MSTKKLCNQCKHRADTIKARDRYIDRLQSKIRDLTRMIEQQNEVLKGYAVEVKATAATVAALREFVRDNAPKMETLSEPKKEPACPQPE